MSNLGKLRSIPAEKVMRSHAFTAGFHDYRAGKKLDDAMTESAAGWSYERGRQFAAIWAGPLRANRQITKATYDAFRTACKANDIR